MRCARHQRNARVMLDGEDFDDITIEVFTCCDEFRKRVESALHVTMSDRRNWDSACPQVTGEVHSDPICGVSHGQSSYSGQYEPR